MVRNVSEIYELLPITGDDGQTSPLNYTAATPDQKKKSAQYEKRN